MGPREIGFVLGVAVGSVLIGALLGWLIRVIFRARWVVADGVGVILLVPLAAIAASANGMMPFSAALGVYSLGALFAWVVLWYVRGRRDAPLPEASSGRWKRPVGIVLLVLLGAVGSTFLFSAFRQVVQPSMFGGSPEFSFLIGALLIVPCFFIYRYMIRDPGAPESSQR
jgi:hypothetical protein